MPQKVGNRGNSGCPPSTVPPKKTPGDNLNSLIAASCARVLPQVWDTVCYWDKLETEPWALHPAYHVGPSLKALAH